MFNYVASIHFSQRSQGLSMSLLIKGEVALERLFDDPASWTLEALGKAVELAREFIWDVCRHNSIGHDLFNHLESNPITL